MAERVGFVLLRPTRSGGTSSCPCAILRLARRAEAHAEAVAGVSEGWRRGWDSHHCRLLKTKNLRDSRFLTIRWIRTKALVETRVEHAELRENLEDVVTIVWSEPRSG
jgi:hypothetical protein